MKRQAFYTESREELPADFDTRYAYPTHLTNLGRSPVHEITVLAGLFQTPAFQDVFPRITTVGETQELRIAMVAHWGENHDPIVPVVEYGILTQKFSKINLNLYTPDQLDYAFARRP